MQTTDVGPQTDQATDISSPYQMFEGTCIYIADMYHTCQLLKISMGELKISNILLRCLITAQCEK